MYDYMNDLTNQVQNFNKMLTLLKYRGPDDFNIASSEHVLLGHCRLSIIDLNGGKQPFKYTYNDIEYTIVYNGEIYNMNTIKEQLIDEGYHFTSQSDTEVVVASFIAYGPRCLNLFDGIFSFVISYQNKLFVARDQLGVKPLYYYQKDDLFIFSSEIKCILSYIGKAVVDQEGVKELLGLGPSMTPGHTIYKGIYSLRPGYYMYFDGHCEPICYWKLHDEEHTDNLEETTQKVKELVIDRVQNQLLSDVPLSTMLSGGLDSSIITAITKQYVQPLTTYSITYEDQEKYFKAYDYQTSMDDDYIREMVERYQSDHHKITLKQLDLLNSLEEALIARDMPGMADVDSSF